MQKTTTLNNDHLRKLYDYVNSSTQKSDGLKVNTNIPYDEKYGIAKSDWKKSEKLLVKFIKNCSYEQFSVFIKEKTMDHIAIKLTQNETVFVVDSGSL